MTNASTAQGREPLDTSEWMRAVEGGDAAAVGSMIEAGVDVDARAGAGETALMRAASKGHLEVVRLLLAAGADVHARSENGFTALFMAVFFGHAPVVRALLEAGSDPSAPMQLNTSPEKWAGLWGDAEIAALLKGAHGERADEVATAEGEQTDEQSPLFPTEGEFRPVVPLSEISEAGATEEAAAPPAYQTGSQEGEAVEDPRAASAANDDAPEEKTLVRAREGRAYAPRALTPMGAGPSWPALTLALALSITAGLLAGTYLIWPRRSAEAPPPAPAAGDAPGAVAANQASGARPADAAAATDEPGPAAASDRHAESDARAEASSAGPRASDAKPAQTIKTNDRHGADADEPPARRVTAAVVADARRPARPAENMKDDSAPSKRTRDDGREARRASAPLSKSAPPISSPPPSARSSNVIKWP